MHSLKFTFELLLLSKHWDLSFMLFKRQRESVSHSIFKAVINLTCTKESFILLSMYVFFGGPLQELEWKRERTENDLSSHVSRWATTSHYASSRFGFSHCVQCHSQGRRQWTTAEQMRNVMKVKDPPFSPEFIALEASSSYAYLLKKSFKCTRENWESKYINSESIEGQSLNYT